MTSLSTDIEQLMAQLAPDTRRQRQSALLRTLNNSLIVITLIGLVLAVTGPAMLIGSVVTGTSLLINLIVGFLARRGHARLAAHLFSIWLNAGTLLLVAINFWYDRNLAMGLLFACQLALSVMLAGLLLGVPYAFLFAVLNTVSVAYLLYMYVPATAAASHNHLETMLSYGTPVAAFLILIAIITWLYQGALLRADKRVEAARRRIIQDELTRRDLALARELQLRLLPPPPLTNPSLRIASRSVPARETSGDFYDFIELDEGQLGIVVADVTGKSVAAALMMALARVAIRSEARRHSNPAEVLRAASATIRRDHTDHQLITAFYGLLDTRTLALRFANAGHPYPILRRGDNLHEIELGGLPLGGRLEVPYQEQLVQLEPGDQLFLLSDGLIEERNDRREMFGYDRLGPAILAADPADPQRALEMLWEAVASFRDTVEQSDDITLVVIQALPVAARAA